MMFTHDRPPHLSPLSHVVCFSVCALEPIRPVSEGAAGTASDGPRPAAAADVQLRLLAFAGKVDGRLGVQSQVQLCCSSAGPQKSKEPRAPQKTPKTKMKCAMREIRRPDLRTTQKYNQQRYTTYSSRWKIVSDCIVRGVARSVASCACVKKPTAVTRQCMQSTCAAYAWLWVRLCASCTMCNVRVL